MTVFEMPQASEDWIKNELKKQMKDDEANENGRRFLRRTRGLRVNLRI